jgi:hypothetical protein
MRRHLEDNPNFGSSPRWESDPWPLPYKDSRLTNRPHKPKKANSFGPFFNAGWGCWFIAVLGLFCNRIAPIEQRGLGQAPFGDHAARRIDPARLLTG